MKSPFALIRKHQKAMMAATTLLAVFAFVVADSLRPSNGGPRGTDRVVVETNTGGLKRSEVDSLLRRRQAANMFMQRAAEICGIQPQQLPLFNFGVGGGDFRKDVVFGYLLSQEAEAIGVTISDEVVTNFIDQFTEKKLGEADFTKIAKDMGVVPRAIYDSLRGELQARTAMELLMPRDPLSPEQYWTIHKNLNVQQALEIAPLYAKDFIKDVPPPGDDTLREYFESHKTEYQNISEEDPSPGFKQPPKVELQYLALRFEDVRKQVEKNNAVTDKEIAEYYAANKEQYLDNSLPELDGPDLKGPDLNGGKKPSSKPLDPLFAPEAKPKTEPEAKETDADAKKPAEEKPSSEDQGEPADGDKEKAPAEPAKEEKSPADEKPAAEKPTTEKPTTEKPATEQSSDEQSSLPSDGTGSTIDETAALTEVTQAQPEENSDNEPAEPSKEDSKEEAKDAKATEKTTEEPVEKPAEKPEEPTKAAAEEAPAAETAKSDPKASGDDSPTKDAPDAKTAEEPKEAPKPKYRELDDDLRDEIRTQLLHVRTQAEMAKIAEKILSEMGNLSDDHSTALETVEDDDGKPQKPDAAAFQAEIGKAEKNLRRLAKETDTEYLTTGLVSYSELRTGEEPEGGEPPTGDRLEQAVQPGATGFSSQGTPTADLAFGSKMLYGPYQAEGTVFSDRFFFWKVADQEEHVPTWDEPGIKEQVLKAWNLEKSIELARKRADELAKAVGDQDLAAGLPEDVKSGETASFSWLYQPSAGVNPSPFSRQPPPTISDVTFLGPVGDESGVLMPGEKFMTTVFDELGVGDIGVAANRDRSAFYVVKVKVRDTVDPDIVGDLFMKANKFTDPRFRMFMSTPYDEISTMERQELVYKWSQELEKSHDLKWVEEDEDAG